MQDDVIDRIADGRTDLVFDYIAAGNSATSKDKDGTSLINWCAYYGDVSAIKFLVANGETLQSLGDDLAQRCRVLRPLAALPTPHREWCRRELRLGR